MTNEKGGKEVSVKEVGCKTGSSWFDTQWVIRKIGQGGAEGVKAKNVSKMSWKLKVVSMVLFCIGKNAEYFGLRG